MPPCLAQVTCPSRAARADDRIVALLRIVLIHRYNDPIHGHADSYLAYAVASDGTRSLIEASSIVIDLGAAEIEIGLN